MRAAKTQAAQMRAIPRSTRKHGAKTNLRRAGSPAQGSPELVSFRRYCSGSATYRLWDEAAEAQGQWSAFPWGDADYGAPESSAPSRYQLLGTSSCGGRVQASGMERKAQLREPAPSRQRRGYPDPPPRSAQKLQSQSPEERSTVPRHTNRLSSNRPDSRFREEA